MKETKRLYLALLVLAAGFFWCMCAGLFWPAQAAEDPEKGARRPCAQPWPQKAAGTGTLFWNCSAPPPGGAGAPRSERIIGTNARRGVDWPTRCAGDGVDDAVRCPQHGNLCCV